MSYRGVFTTLLVVGLSASVTPASAESLYSSHRAGTAHGAAEVGSMSGNIGHAVDGNILSVSFDSSDERTVISIDRFMGTHPAYRIERIHRRAEQKGDEDARLEGDGDEGATTEELDLSPNPL